MSFKKFKGASRNILLWAGVFFVVSLFFLAQLTDYSRETKQFSYSAFLQRVEADEVDKVHVEGQELYGTLKNKVPFETVVPQPFADAELLRSHHVDVTYVAPAGSMGFWHIVLLLFLIGLPIAAWFMVRQSRGGSK